MMLTGKSVLMLEESLLISPRYFGDPVCVPNLQDLMHVLCEQGYEHHVSMVRGHVADIVEEALTKYLG